MKRVVFFIVVFIICTYADSIENGINWLKTEQEANGNWTDSLVSDFHATSYSVITLKKYNQTNSNYTQGLNWIQNEQVHVLDYLALQTIILDDANISVQEKLEILSQAQNPDAGFGIAKNYNSSILDGAIILKTLLRSGNSQIISNGLNFIKNYQNVDGGWGIKINDPSNIYVTSLVIDFFSNCGQFDVGTAIDSGITFLQNMQNPDGGFGADSSTIFETAWAGIALGSADVLGQTYSNAINFLLSRQQTNGSWQNSSYQTSITLLALLKSNPDLAINTGDISFIPSLPLEGDTVAISAIIHNLGSEPGEQVLVQFYDGNPDSGGIKIIELTIAQLEPGGIDTLTTVYFTQGKPGRHFIHVLIDPYDNIIENSEENNHGLRMLRVIGGPDLEISGEDFSFYPPYPAPDQDIILSARILNAGQITLTAVELGFYDGHPDSGGILIDSIFIIPSIPSLGYASVELTTILSQGDHNVYAIADPQDKIDEIDETNNTVHQLVQIYNWMDLAVYSWGISVSNETPYDGDTIQICAAIFNIKENIATDVRVRLYDGDPDSGGIQINEDFIIDTILPGQFKSIFTDWHLWYIGGKHHYIFVIVDPDSEIIEIDETNNRAHRRINILGIADYTGKPERIFTAYPNEYHPLIPEDGDTTRVYAYLFNIGTFPIRGKDHESRYLKAKLFHNHPDSGGQFIGEYWQPYYPYANDSISFYGEWNTLGCEGDNTFYLFIDPDERFSELREDNNIIRAILPVNPAANTDLAIHGDDIIFEPVIPITGDTLLITATVHTLRNKSADNVVIQFFDGNPEWNGILIGEDTIPEILPLSSANGQFSWNTENLAGYHDIYIVVDPYDSIAENNENNNVSYAEISIRLAPEFSPKNLSALALDTATILINWQPPDSEVLGYKVYRNDALINIPFNIATEGSASASEYNGSNIPQNAIDGDNYTRWLSDYYPDTLWFCDSFSQPITFDRISIRWYIAPEYCYLQIWKNMDWQTIWADSIKSANYPVTIHSFYDLVTTDRVRIYIPGTEQTLIGIFELDIYSTDLITDTTFTDTFLGAGHYHYYATGIDSPLAESPPSNYDSILKGDFIPPSPPQNLEANIYGNIHLVRLTWDSPPEPDVFGYHIYLDNEPLLIDSTITWGKESNPEYKCYDNFLNQNFYFPPPSNCRRKLFFSRFSTENNHDFLYLYHYPESEVDRFTGKKDSFEHYIYPSNQHLRFITDCAGTRSGWEIPEIVIYADIKVRSYDHYNYQAGTYTYGVTAIDGWGNESDTSMIEVVISDTIAPSSPTGLSAIPGEHKAFLTWLANTESDILGYNIYRTDTTGPLNSEPRADTTYIDTGLTSHQTYTYYVTALDHNYLESDPSDSVSVLIAMVDLVVNDENIIHVPSHPRDNFPVITSIKVMNIGFDPCDSALVLFYDNHPDTGILLDSNIISIPASGSKTTEIEWQGVAGMHDIWIKVMPINTQDFDTTNNLAHKPVKIFPEGAKIVMFDDGHIQFYTADSANQSTYSEATGAFCLFASLLEDSGNAIVTLAPGEKFSSYTLDGIDVLILHCPSLYGWAYTSPPSPAYEQDEIDAVDQFVKEGGGLLLIGDNTFFQVRFDDLTKEFGILWQGGLLYCDETPAVHEPGYSGFVGFFDSTHFQNHPTLEGVSQIFSNYTNILIPSDAVPVVITDSGMAPDNMPVIAAIPEDPIHTNSITGKGRIFICSDLNSFDNKEIDPYAGETNYRIYKGDDEIFAVNIINWLAEDRNLGLPDPALTQHSIEIQDSFLITGRTSEINVTIYNYGETNVSDLSFLFSLGHPDSNGTIIIDTIIPFIPPVDSISFIVNWRPLLGGVQKLYAVLDHDNQINEASESNNLAIVEVEISDPVHPDLAVIKVRVEPNPLRQGEIATLSSVIHNFGLMVPEFDVGFYLGDPDSGGTYIGSFSSTTPLSPFDSMVATIMWAPIGLEGVHKIFALVDPNNNIQEENEKNNKNFTYIEIISTPISISVSLNDTLYNPHEDVSITATIHNLGISLWNGDLIVQVEDSSGNLTAVVDTLPITGISSPYGDWHFMIPVEVNPAYAPIRDGVASVKIDFVHIFNQLGYEGTHLDTNSIRVIEFERYGILKQEKISRLYFHPDTQSIIIWKLDGFTDLDQSRYFIIYFDITENGPKPAPDSILPQDLIAFYQSGRYNENPIRLIPSNGDGTFSSAIENDLFGAFLGTYPVALTIGDIDKDQTLDFISPMGYANLARLYLLPNVIDTSFNQERISSSLFQKQDTIFSDILLEYERLFNTTSTRSHLEKQMSARDDTSARIIRIGKFWDINIRRLYNPQYRNLELADFNNDGLIDIIGSAARHGSYIYGDIIRVMSQHYLFLFLNNDDTTFSRTQLTQIYFEEVITDLDVADFNRDGNTDVLIITWPDQSYQYIGYAYILFGNGDGTFEPAKSVGLDNIIGQAAVDDFDCDGIVDIISGQQFNSPNRPKFFKGIDDTTFADPVYLNLDPEPQIWGGGLHFDHYDYNYDGYPDLLVFHIDYSSSDRFQLIYYPGNGDRTFGIGTKIDSMPYAGTGSYEHEIQCSALPYHPKALSEIGTPQLISDSLIFNLTWNTGQTPAGQYQMHVLTSEYGGIIAEDTAGFTILAQAELYAQIQTDKPSYNAQENVMITAKVVNQSENVIYYNITENVSLITPILDTLPIGSRQIERLDINEQSIAEYVWQTGINPSGTYLLFSIITDTTGDTLAQAQTTFDIEQSSGYMMALSGMIEALPTVVTRPNDFLLSYSVTNIGNIDLDTLIIKEVIVDAALQSMIYSRIDTISLPINGTVLHDSLFSSLSFDFGDYILGLYAVLPDSNITIATNGFRIIELAPPDFELKKSANKIPRPLVWLHTEEEQQFITDLFDTLRIYYQVVNNYSDFEKEFRSDKYNLYFIFPDYSNGPKRIKVISEKDSVPDHIRFKHSDQDTIYRFTQELREVVYAGDGFILIRWPVDWQSYWDSLSYKDLNEITGAKADTLISEFEPYIYLDTSAISPAETLGICDSVSFALILSNSQAVGWFHKDTLQYPGVVLNDYGKGRSVFFDFNLVSSIDSLNVQAYKNLVLSAINYVVPETTQDAPYACFDLEMLIENRGPTYRLNVVELIPEAIDIVAGLDSGLVSGQNITWNFELARNAQKPLAALLRFQDLPEVYDFITELSYLRDGIYHLYNMYALNLILANSTLQLIDQAIEGLDTLSLTGQEEEYQRIAIAALRRVRYRPIQSQSDLIDNIKDTIQAIEYILMIQSVDLSELRRKIDVILRIWEVKWYLW